MSIVFQALVFVTLLLPGFTLRYSYNGNFSAEEVHNFPPITRESIKILIYSVILHVLWTGIVNILGFNPRIETVLYFLVGNYSDAKAHGIAIESVSSNLGKVFSYFISLIIFSMILGSIWRKGVRYFSLDIESTWFTYNNKWHYILWGELKELEYETIDGTLISAVVDCCSQSYLYLGYLVDYYFDSNGELDRIVLQDTFRRELIKDKEEGGCDTHHSEDDRYYKVEGDYFILKYKDIRSLNIKYLDLVDDSGQSDESVTEETEPPPV